MINQELSYVPQLPAELLQYAKDDLHLLLDSKKCAWAVVNQTGMEIANLCDGTRDVQTIAALLAQRYQISVERARQDTLSYIHNLAGAGLLCSDADEISEQPQLPALKGIYLHVTNRCNLRCRHCYVAGMGVGELLSLEAILRLIDQLVQIGCDTVILTGGEPLLRNDIKQILGYAARKLKTILATNGTLIDEDMAEFLSSLGVCVQVSLDGVSRSTHEAIRGEGTFERTIRAIELLLAHDMGKYLALSISITKPNLAEVSEMIEFAVQSGISQLNAHPVVAQGNALLNWDQINPTPDEYAKLFDELYPLILRHRDELVIRGCLIDFVFDTLSSPQDRGCPVGEKLMVDSNGDVYPCPVVSHPDYRLGNIRNESLSEIRSSHKMKQIYQQFASRAEHIAKCQTCQWRGFCRAACPAAVLWQKGTIWDVDALCDVRAALYSKLIFEYAESVHGMS
jgi:radical SAM protein with 4Fe4S-binding SPASM domain